MTLSKELEREHGDIDEGIHAFTAGAPDADTLARALDLLRRHIFFEEEKLFPPLRQAGLVPPLFVMCREHGEMWATMGELMAAVGPGADPVHLRELVVRLMAQLQEHNTKEEMIVYPAAEQMIAPPALEELGTELAAVELPAGWVCETAR